MGLARTSELLALPARKAAAIRDYRRQANTDMIWQEIVLADSHLLNAAVNFTPLADGSWLVVIDDTVSSPLPFFMLRLRQVVSPYIIAKLVPHKGDRLNLQPAVRTKISRELELVAARLLTEWFRGKLLPERG